MDPLHPVAEQPPPRGDLTKTYVRRVEAELDKLDVEGIPIDFRRG